MFGDIWFMMHCHTELKNSALQPITRTERRLLGRGSSDAAGSQAECSLRSAVINGLHPHSSGASVPSFLRCFFILTPQALLHPHSSGACLLYVTLGTALSHNIRFAFKYTFILLKMFSNIAKTSRSSLNHNFISPLKQLLKCSK